MCPSADVAGSTGRRVPVVVATALAAVIAAGWPGALLADEPAPPSFRAEREVVLLDIVVRDRRGSPVTDLRADEVPER